MNNMDLGNLVDTSFRQAFEGDLDLQRYGRNALMLFTLSLYLQIENLEEFATDAITDSGNDKSIDLCYLDEEQGRVIVTQSYFANEWGRPAASSKKASDLNTAAVWLLDEDLDKVPSNLRPKAEEIRRVIREGTVNRIELFFIHNCMESSNVNTELKAAARTFQQFANSLLLDSERSVMVTTHEYGIAGIEELYRSRDSIILIDDWISVPSSSWIEEKGRDWRAIVTSVPGSWIRELRMEYGDRLFSANFRDYLGVAKRKGNINQQIAQTIVAEPFNFWVYNNGVTALTHQLDISQEHLRIRGMSIINGAQTSGALGESVESDAQQTKVLLRVVDSDPTALIEKITLYNNTQNEIKPADKRSNDPVQKRLHREFEKRGITYVHRRSFSRIPRTALTGASLGRVLCAFHGDLQTAYRNARDIFDDDSTYEQIFRKNIVIEHLFLVHSLSSAIDQVKSELKTKVTENEATSTQSQQYDLLKYSASKHFVLYIVGKLAEEILNRRVVDLYEWRCRPEHVAPDNKRLVTAWKTALLAMLPLLAQVVSNKGKDAAYEVPRSATLSKETALELSALLSAVETTLAAQFVDIRKYSVI